MTLRYSGAHSVPNSHDSCLRSAPESLLTPILATKLYIPPPPPKAVLRPRLVERLNAGLHRKLTLISAPAGFGKTTLVSAWVAGCNRQVTWLSLDEGDNDLTTISNDFVLVIDDYHVIDAQPVDAALTFLLEHLPPRMRLVITSREDPQVPLARLRGGGQLSELRSADLRFTPSEAAAFLNEAMGLNLLAEDVTTLENRTEGWIAGLQLAALSLQGHPDATSFIQSFTGSHRFVLDYLLEEVLQRQLESVQTFLLRTSILDRLCGPLCDAVLGDPAVAGQVTLEYLERANLFVVPLDNDRCWYRYHHLFADLLR